MYLLELMIGPQLKFWNKQQIESGRENSFKINGVGKKMQWKISLDSYFFLNLWIRIQGALVYQDLTEWAMHRHQSLANHFGKDQALKPKWIKDI